MPLHSNGRFPTSLSPPSRASSVTLWEATAPVKLPAMQGSRIRMTAPVRHHDENTGWYFTGGSIRAGAAELQSLPPIHTGRLLMPMQSCVKVHGVFPSNRGTRIFTENSFR